MLHYPRINISLHSLVRKLGELQHQSGHFREDKNKDPFVVQPVAELKQVVHEVNHEKHLSFMSSLQTEI
jgi:hypothetical protein